MRIDYPGWMPNNTTGITEPWDVEVAHFVDWVSSNRKETPLCQALDAARAAEACWAAVLSNKERRVVELPLITNLF